eukprot:Skav221682  [mRNA]  locus=scaffold1494:115102:119238:+ [translate_table: standard]
MAQPPLRTASVDLQSFYAEERPDEENRASWVGMKRRMPAHSTSEHPRDHVLGGWKLIRNGPVLDDDLLADAEIAQVIKENAGRVQRSLDIRSPGGSPMGQRCPGELHLDFTGSAGQSFGVWNTGGVFLKVTGDANDYVGKGMNGGQIVAVAPPTSTFQSQENVIAGNTCLYGATGGEAGSVFLNGTVGERFGVRNAGCCAVIEGAGDHLGEWPGPGVVKGWLGWYMTNGVIVALGAVGRNVAAGMSGGILYLYQAEASR